MAYVTVIDECLDEDHDHCPRYENTPTDPDVVGGGLCICPCHNPDVKREWYEQVRESAIRARERRAADQ